jgi:hypothetical protein
MDNDGDNSKRGLVLWGIQMIVSCALVIGLVWAFGDDFRQFTARSWRGRRNSGDTVWHDTGAKIVRRFAMGACGGAAFGAFIVIPGICWKKGYDA